MKNRLNWKPRPEPSSDGDYMEGNRRNLVRLIDELEDPAIFAREVLAFYDVIVLFDNGGTAESFGPRLGRDLVDTLLTLEPDEIAEELSMLREVIFPRVKKLRDSFNDGKRLVPVSKHSVN
ncbi:MAG TPA: hypothetical protein VG938_07590 [Verrucomicrobiae bacterium]|nr:hypothetical protein [Verrucomicrobiae bacterium]